MRVTVLSNAQLGLNRSGMGRRGAAVVLHPQGGRAAAVQRGAARAGGRPDHGRDPGRASAAGPELLPVFGRGLETRPTDRADDRQVRIRRPTEIRRCCLIAGPHRREPSRLAPVIHERSCRVLLGGFGQRCRAAHPGLALNASALVGVGRWVLPAPGRPPQAAARRAGLEKSGGSCNERNDHGLTVRCFGTTAARTAGVRHAWPGRCLQRSLARPGVWPPFRTPATSADTGGPCGSHRGHGSWSGARPATVLEPLLPQATAASNRGGRCLCPVGVATPSAMRGTGVDCRRHRRTVPCGRPPSRSGHPRTDCRVRCLPGGCGG